MLEIHAHLNWYLYENTKILFDEFWRLVSRGLENEDILIKYGCFNKDNEILNLIQKSQLGLGQICGTTFKKIENLEIEYLGSFVNDDQIKEGYYRSMIVARKGINIKETELRAAINQKDSYSGRFALYSYFNSDFKKPSFKNEIYTGSHFNTINQMCFKRVDIGSIDYVSWRAMKEIIPNQLNELEIVGVSKIMPSPPLICSSFKDKSLLNVLKSNLANVFKNSELRKEFNKIGILGLNYQTSKDYDVFKSLKI